MPPEETLAADAATDAEETTVETTDTADDTSTATGTIADGNDGGDKEVVAPADWPEDWRQKLAGEDQKALQRLNRFKSPETVFKSWASLDSRMGAGELKAVSPFPEDGDEAAQAAWREENGIPAEPAAYLESLPDGLVIGEDDKELVERFAQAMHAGNAPPAAVHKAIEWYYAHLEDVQASTAENDAGYRKEAEDTLRGEWGAEYRANVNTIKRFLDGQGEDLSSNLFGARLADGTLLGDNPDTLRFLLNMASEVDPGASVVGGESSQRFSNIEAEIAEIEKVMKTDNRAYWSDKGMQDRYSKLLTARDRAAMRG